MLTVRRIYMYAVSAISLVAVAWGVIALARLIFDGGIGRGQITGLAWALAVIIVGTPIFLFHWLLAQRWAAANPEEQASPIRRTFLYVVMAAAATPIFANIYRLVDNLFLTLLGGTHPTYYPYDMSTVDHLSAIVIWAVVWFFVWRMVRQLPAGGPLEWVNRTIRRVYLLVFSLGGLVMLSFGGLGLLQMLMELLTGSGSWRTPVAHNIAQLLVGGGVWAGHWFILQRDFASGHPAEERSVLRKVYLYMAVFVFSVMALSSGTLLLKRLFELALGAPPSTEPLLSQLSTVVPMLIVGGVFWAYHWFVIREDAAQAPDGPRQAAVRRIYAYLVAAVGLAALLTGIGGLLTLIVDVATSGADVGLATYRESLALFAAMTLVATPVWWLPWQARQKRAVLPPAPDGARDTGSEERRSVVRKIYLYLFMFAAALAVFGSVGWFVFHILTALLGADLPADFITQVLDAFVISVLAVGVWLYHWWAIRGDGKLADREQAAQLAEITVAVVDGGEGRLGRAVVDKLRHDLPGLQVVPLGVTSQAVAAMAGEPFSAAGVETANYIIGDWQTFSRSEVEPAVETSPATKFVLPVSNGKWQWVGVGRQSAGDYAAQISRGLQQAIEGEAVDFGGGLDATTVAGIALGGLLFLCIAGGLLVAGINVF